MKQFKILKHKILPDTYGFVLEEFNEMGTTDVPKLFSMSTTIEGFEAVYWKNPNILNSIKDEYDLVTVWVIDRQLSIFEKSALGLSEEDIGYPDAGHNNKPSRMVQLENALSNYVKASGNMRNRWSESNDEVKTRLWKRLHECEQPALDLLLK